MDDLGFVEQEPIEQVMDLDIFFPHGQIGSSVQPRYVTEAFILARTDVPAESPVWKLEAEE